MMGSNSYLGLTNHPLVKEAAIKAIQNTEAVVLAVVFKWHFRYSPAAGNNWQN